jgi:hypothetical protein
VPLEYYIGVNGNPDYVKKGQHGYLSETEGLAGYNIYFNTQDGQEIEYVQLDTTVLGTGVQVATEPKGEAGYVFPLRNDAGLGPGNYIGGYTIHFLGGEELLGEATFYIVDQIPEPWFPPSVIYGSFGEIGDIDFSGSDFTMDGCILQMTFRPNEVVTDCTEYRWIQLFTTNTPVSPYAGLEYLCPYGNDDPPGDEMPYYWTDTEAPAYNYVESDVPLNPVFYTMNIRPGYAVTAGKHRMWWHSEIILVGVRESQPDVLLHSIQGYEFAETMSQGMSIYSGGQGASEYARRVITDEFPGYEFE